MKKCPFCGEFLSDDAIQCKSCERFLDGKERVDERCECGNLVAKLTEDTIEIKCRRCKRIHVIHADMLSERYHFLKERMEMEDQEPE
jgi:phage FluMu protein Com